MDVLCMQNASGHIYRNSSVIVDLAMGQILRSTKRIFSLLCDEILLAVGLREWEQEGMGIINKNGKKMRIILGSGMGINHWEWTE